METVIINDQFRTLLEKSKEAVVDLGCYASIGSIFDSIIDELIITIPDENLTTMVLFRKNQTWDLNEERTSELSNMIKDVNEKRNSDICATFLMFDDEESLLKSAQYYLSALDYDINYNGNAIGMDFINVKLRKLNIEPTATETKGVNKTGVYQSAPSFVKHEWISKYSSGAKVMTVGMFENLATAELYKQSKK